MKIVANFVTVIVFTLVLFLSSGLLLSATKLGTDAWGYGVIYVMFVGPFGYAAVTVLSRFMFEANPGGAAMFFGLVLAIETIVVVIMNTTHIGGIKHLDDAYVLIFVTGPVLLSATVREIILFLFEPLTGSRRHSA